MLDFKNDKPKTVAQIRKDLGKGCMICGRPLTQMQGLGSETLCREHQLQQREYGGMGRTDRPHTFHRSFVCTACGWDSLTDPRLADLENEDVKRSVARVLMHGDHGQRQADGGDDSADNLTSLCFVCHAKKTILSGDHLTGTARTRWLEQIS